jgi:cardiolipin synthase
MLHAKAFIVDSNTCAVGSANVDTRSFRLSFEVSCVFKDERTCDHLSEWFGGLVAGSHQVTIDECLKRSTGEKLLESMAHLWSPLL